ncbi:DgyrCDS3689 [Dimorphilus gyrociliatus]|uniref:DgyrCDS3689 n=1 Tax=Dimorphilus gyrociliatus TaxID=2664684 RepID=A0A7I8VEL9_9ANNE|nr:DgyrCDS3689 [Dimorphilus gyrociliatus]
MSENSCHVCPACTTKSVLPRLPCNPHKTYCSTCIENLCTNKNLKPTDNLLCPTCRAQPQKSDDGALGFAVANAVKSNKVIVSNEQIEMDEFNKTFMIMLRNEIKKTRKSKDEQIARLNESTSFFEECIKSRRDELQYYIEEFYETKEDRILELLRGCSFLGKSIEKKNEERENREQESEKDAEDTSYTESCEGGCDEEEIERRQLDYVFSKDLKVARKELEELKEQITKPEAIFKPASFINRPDFGTIIYTHAEIPHEDKRFVVGGNIEIVKSYVQGIYVVSKKEYSIVVNNIISGENIEIDLSDDELSIHDICLGGDGYLYHILFTPEDLIPDPTIQFDKRARINQKRIFYMEHDLCERSRLLDCSNYYIVSQPTENFLIDRISFKFFNQLMLYDRVKNIIGIQVFKK